MIDYKALCAELADELHGYASANPHHDSDELVIRARAALAAEPEPPAEGEVADPVIPGEYRGFNAVAYRNGFHAGYKHALTRAALAAEPDPSCDGDALTDAMQHLLSAPMDSRGYLDLRSGSRIAARLALAAEAEGPSKTELRRLFLDHSGYIDDEPAMFWSDFYASVRAALARWGNK